MCVDFQFLLMFTSIFSGVVHCVDFRPEREWLKV